MNDALRTGNFLIIGNWRRFRTHQDRPAPSDKGSHIAPTNRKKSSQLQQSKTIVTTYQMLNGSWQVVAQLLDSVEDVHLLINLHLVPHAADGRHEATGLHSIVAVNDEGPIARLILRLLHDIDEGNDG
jgi:hypothetical protein